MVKQCIHTENDLGEEMEMAPGVLENPTDGADIDGDSGEYVILDEL